jgi:hypothetical protein
LTQADALVFLLGSFLGLVLRLRGVCCLHASVIVVGGKGVALAGHQGAGKSTTAAALARRGFPVLADDIAALADQETTFLVQPGIPRLLLLPSAVGALWGAPDVLPWQSPNAEKRCLLPGRSEIRFWTEPAPLGAVYILRERDESLRSPRIESPSGAEGLVGLLTHAYLPQVLDPEMRVREFRLLTRVFRQVRVRSVQLPGDLDRLDELCNCLVQDMAHLVRDEG